MSEQTLKEEKFDYKTHFDKGYKNIQGVLTTGAEEAPFVAQMSEFAMAYQGVNGHEFLSNPVIFVEANLRTSAELGCDVPDVMWDVYDIECEAGGG